jgi:ribonuclease HII
MPPSITFEQQLHGRGLRCLAGLDEAGRGCWAGPVVAAAVVLGPQVLANPALLAGIDDSKQMTAAARDAGYEHILRHAAGVGVGVVAPYLIDGYGILEATRLAMTVALLHLPCCPDGLLIDAVPLRALHLPQEVLIKGDGRSLSIAAASVVAKVTRDRLMHTADHAFPGYGFASHKGYGTAMHQEALAQHGVCMLHRRTFRPIAELVTFATEGTEGTELKRET